MLTLLVDWAPQTKHIVREEALYSPRWRDPNYCDLVDFEDRLFLAFIERSLSCIYLVIIQ